jgi:hypothetical protein
MESHVFTNDQPTHGENNVDDMYMDDVHSLPEMKTCTPETNVSPSSNSETIESIAKPTSTPPLTLNKSPWDEYYPNRPMTDSANEFESTSAMTTNHTQFDTSSRKETKIKAENDQTSLSTDPAEARITNIVELPPQSSAETTGRATTTTTLFATTMLHYDTDVNTLSRNNKAHLENIPLNASHDVPPDSAYLEQQIQVAEAMYEKSNGLDSSKNNNHPEISFGVSHVKQGHVVPSDDPNNNRMKSVLAQNEGKSLSELQPLRGETAINSAFDEANQLNLDRARSIFNFGQTLSYHHNPPTNIRNQSAIESEKSSVKKVTVEGVRKSKLPKETEEFLTFSEGIEISRDVVEYPNLAVNVEAKGMTERIMNKIDGSKLGPSMFMNFKQLENEWTKIRQQSQLSNAPSNQNHLVQQSSLPFVTLDAALGNPKCWTKLREQYTTAILDYDIVFYGDAKGVILALALLLSSPSIRIGVIQSGTESHIIDEEWQASSAEFNELVKLGLLTEKDVKEIIVSELPSGRFGFQVGGFG